MSILIGGWKSYVAQAQFHGVVLRGPGGFEALREPSGSGAKHMRIRRLLGTVARRPLA